MLKVMGKILLGPKSKQQLYFHNNNNCRGSYTYITFFPVCMSYPARLVTDEADEQGGQFCTSDLWRGGIGDHHEALGTGFPDAPQTV